MAWKGQRDAEKGTEQHDAEWRFTTPTPNDFDDLLNYGEALHTARLHQQSHCSQPTLHQKTVYSRMCYTFQQD